ncbi:prepilin peptidase, partial [Streptomyces sp. SID5477]|nr:prepilin peptidase [Streptomyces sp. SID5477]
MLLIAIVDGENFWLPDVLTWPLAATGLIAAALSGWNQAIAHLIGAIVGF